MITSRIVPSAAGLQLPNPVTTDLPELQKTSDIVFGQWKLAAHEGTNRIHYIIGWSITNKDTPSIIRRALQSVGQNTLEKYPQCSFTMDSEAGQALLG